MDKFITRKKKKEERKRRRKKRKKKQHARDCTVTHLYVEFRSRVIDTVGHVVFRHSAPRCRSIGRCVTFRIFPPRRENTVRNDARRGRLAADISFGRPVRNRVERWKKGGGDAWSRLKPRETAIALATSVAQRRAASLPSDVNAPSSPAFIPTIFSFT